MAITWSGYRLITVADRRFRWACSFHHPAEAFSVGYVDRGPDWAPDRLLIRPEDDPQRLLTVHWPACRGPVITPGRVRACVEEAIRRDWPGALAVLDLAGGDLPLSRTSRA